MGKISSHRLNVNIAEFIVIINTDVKKCIIFFPFGSPLNLYLIRITSF